MAVTSAFTVANLKPSLNIDSSQRFILGLQDAPEPLGSFKIDNIFTPTVSVPSQTNIEYRNKALSGFRWTHTTNSTDTFGSFKLQSFVGASPTGADIWSFNQDGSISVKAPITFEGEVNFPGGGATWADLGVPTAPVDFGNQRLLNVGTGTASTDGVNKGQVEAFVDNHTWTTSQITDFPTAVAAFRLDQFAAPTSALTLNNQRLTNLANPTANQDATSKLYVDSRTWLSASITDLASTVKAYPLNSFASPTASLNLNNQKITNLSDPTLAQDGATKFFVDNHTWTTSQITNFSTSVLGFRLDQFVVPNTSINLNSQKITSLLDPTLAQDAATKIYVDNHTWTTGQITNFSTSVLAFRLDQFAAPTGSVSLNSQKIINLLNPTSNQDATTKSYVDTHTWTTSQITDFATAVPAYFNTINLTGAVTGAIQTGGAIPTLLSATQSLNFWRQSFNWNPATGTNPSPILPSGAPYYSWTHNLPDNSNPPLHYYEVVSGTRTLRFSISPGSSSTQTGGFFFTYLNSASSTNVSLFDVSMNSGSPLANIYALLNMNSKQIINVVDPTTPQGVATKNFVDTHLWSASSIPDLATTVQGYALSSFAPPTTGINMSNQRMINLQNPVLAQDAVTKTYVDNKTWTTSQITDFATAVTSFRIDQFAPPAGNLNLNGLNIDNLNSLGIGRAAVGTARLSFSNGISSRKIALYDAIGTNDNYNFSGFGASATDTIYNCPINGSHTFYTGANGNLAMQIIRTQLYMDSTSSSSDFRKVVFWQDDVNPHQSVAIGNSPKGASDTIMCFQVSNANGDFVFRSGINSTSSKTVATLLGTGDASFAGTIYGRCPSGSLSMQNNATATSITTAGSWIKVAGTTTAANLNQWTMPLSNRLTYVGTTSSTIFINVYLTASQNDTTAAEIKFALYKNGVQLSTSVMSEQMSQNVLSNFSLGVIAPVTTGDYFELYVSHPIASRTVLVKNLTIIPTQT